MSNEIQSNIDRANFLIENKEKGLSNCTRLENILLTSSPIDSLEIFFSGFSFRFDHPNFNSSAYQEAQSTGALYNLGSDSLIFKIEKYYLRCERETFYMLKIGEKMQQDILNSPYVIARTEYESINRYNAPKAFFLSQNKWLGDKNHPDYRRCSFEISSRRRANIDIRNRCDSIIQESEKLMAAIKEELKN